VKWVFGFILKASVFEMTYNVSSGTLMFTYLLTPFQKLIKMQY